MKNLYTFFSCLYTLYILKYVAQLPDSAVWKKQKMFLPHPRVKVSIVGSLRDREVACSASDRVWRTVSSQSSHHPQKVLLSQFSLYVHKGGLKPDSSHLMSPSYATSSDKIIVSQVGKH